MNTRYTSFPTEAPKKRGSTALAPPPALATSNTVGTAFFSSGFLAALVVDFFDDESEIYRNPS
jgi:hypothetical protein